MATLTGVSLASDAFFPFRDSIDVASTRGVEYLVAAGIPTMCTKCVSKGRLLGACTMAPCGQQAYLPRLHCLQWFSLQRL